MTWLGLVIGQLVVKLPVLIVLVVGLILMTARRRRFGDRAGRLAVIGLGRLAVEAVLNLAWSVAWPHLLLDLAGEGIAGQVGVLNGFLNIVFALATAGGIGSLIAALFAGHRHPPVYVTASPHAPPLFLPRSE